MKSNFLRPAISLLKGLICGKRKEAIAMETYLSTSSTIQKLIDTHKLGINLKERHVVIDVSLHLCFINTSGSKKGDKKYTNFFDKIIAYMNMQLGVMGKKEFIDPQKDTITFHVIIERYHYVDDKGSPLPAHKQITYDTIAVGAYRHGIIDYKSVDNNEPR